MGIILVKNYQLIPACFHLISHDLRLRKFGIEVLPTTRTDITTGKNYWTRRMKIHSVLLLLFALSLSACAGGAYAKVIQEPALEIPVSGSLPVTAAEAVDQETKEQMIPRQPAELDLHSPAAGGSSKPTEALDIFSERFPTDTPTVKPITIIETFDPEMWKDWPVVPVVSQEMRDLYQQGLEKGNNPHAFSILGDCQSEPAVFMGIFDKDADFVSQLPEHYQETIENFSGSFNRYSPTVKDGTTEGALLWVEWNDNKDKKCRVGETPLDCELRVNNPSIVFVHVGTHWERRSQQYFNRIIVTILEHKAVPILVTKADNRELDERINRNYAQMAIDHKLPLWNFWTTVQHLPNNGMKPDSSMYLTNEAMLIHREGALQALDAVWRALR
jgi:hypothetical protein